RIGRADRARGRVPGIGERRLAAVHPLAIGPLEGSGRQVDLAANVEPAGNRLAERQPDRADRFEIAGRMLGDEAVSARRALYEPGVLIGQIDGQTVGPEPADVPNPL